MEFKFDVKKHDNGRTFHTNVEVGMSSIEHYGSRHTATSSEVYHKERRIVANMVMDVLTFRGVNDVFVKPYEVSVYLDTNPHCPISWNEGIDRCIENAFRDLYRAENPTKPGKKVIIKDSGLRKGFHTNFEVSKSHIESFDRPLRDYDDQNLNYIGPDGASLVRKLMRIPGITKVWMEPYEVAIHIGEVFSWTEHDVCGKSIVEKVEETFKIVFGSDIAFV